MYSTVPITCLDVCRALHAVIRSTLGLREKCYFNLISYLYMDVLTINISWIILSSGLSSRPKIQLRHSVYIYKSDIWPQKWYPRSGNNVTGFWWVSSSMPIRLSIVEVDSTPAQETLTHHISASSSGFVHIAQHWVLRVLVLCMLGYMALFLTATLISGLTWLKLRNPVPN